MSTAKKLQGPISVPLADIRRDGGTQSRAELSEETISDYAGHVESLPPVVVFHDGAAYWLADGFHRCAAFERAGCNNVPCDVHQGTLRDAVLWSVGANAIHGLRRSNADKRRAVALLLSDEEWQRRSDPWIADKCCVSQPFVLKVRAEHITVIGSESREGRDGKIRKMPERKVATPACGHGCGVDDDGVCLVCADRAKKGLGLGPTPGDPWDLVGDRGPADDTDTDFGEPSPASKPEPARVATRVAAAPDPLVARLEALAAQRYNDPAYQALRATQRTIAAQIPQSSAQRMVDFVLDGGELALLRLGLDWTVTGDSLRAAYRAASLKAHPDRGGSNDEFTRLTRARDLVAGMIGGAT